MYLEQCCDTIRHTHNILATYDEGLVMEYFYIVALLLVLKKYFFSIYSIIAGIKENVTEQRNKWFYFES